MTTSFTAMEQRYRDQIVEHYNRLSLTGLPERAPGLHGVPLEKVFVRLNTEVAQAGRLDVGLAGERARLQTGPDLATEMAHFAQPPCRTVPQML